jgi:(R,R)-butanediol dehydrogenase/meso-butanediol dehydrogenase/diacetyl reductase
LAAATLLAARASGVQILAVTEVNRERAESMRVLGATHVIDPSRAEAVAEVKALSGGEGVDVVFDCVGKSVTRLNGLDMLARGGTALFLGTEDNETNLPFGDLIRREIGVQTSYAYNETDFATAFDFVVEGGANTAAFTEIVPMEEGQGAFDRLVSGPGGCLKIALRP